MKYLKFWFGILSCTLLMGIPQSCTKKDLTPNSQDIAKSSSLTAEKTSPSAPPADPAIAYVAYGKPDIPANRHLMVMNADGSNQTAILTGIVAGLSWSPDGHSLLFGKEVKGLDSLWIVDVSVVNGIPKGSNFRQVPISNVGNVGGGRWSPKGDLILFTVGDQNIYTVPITGGTPTIVYTSPTGLIPFDPEWSPDESKIVFDEWTSAYDKSDLAILDLGSSQLTSVVPLGPALIVGPRWSQQGDRIAYQAPNGSTTSVYTVTPTANAIPVKITDGTSQVWSPDGSKLALVVSSKSGFRVVSYAFNGGTTQSLASGNWPDWRRF